MNGTDLRVKFDEQWGMFRRFIAMHPLTGFWVGCGFGFAMSYPIRGLLGLIL